MTELYVEIRSERARGCGYRKPGKSGVGIYLVGTGALYACDLLPLLLHVCPVCGSGIKATRGWGWIDPQKLFESLRGRRDSHRRCLVGEPPPGRHGLVWVGEGYYKTPDDFLSEVVRMGVSRKLPAVPKDFVPGETVVYLAHRKASLGFSELGEDILGPAIFSAFRPTGIDLVVLGDSNNVPKAAVRLKEKLGDFATLVKVESMLIRLTPKSGE